MNSCLFLYSCYLCLFMIHVLNQLPDSKAQCSRYYLHCSPNHLASQILILKDGGGVGTRAMPVPFATSQQIFTETKLQKLNKHSVGNGTPASK